MAKNKDGLEAGKPVSAEDFKRVHNAHKTGKPIEEPAGDGKPNYSKMTVPVLRGLIDGMEGAENVPPEDAKKAELVKFLDDNWGE